VKDKDLRQRIGHNARLKVENLSWDKMADETMMLYREVLADSHKAR